MPDPNLDSNQWYHLYVTSGPGQGLIGNKPSNGDPSSGVWFNPTNTTKLNFRWQIFKLNSTVWTLRCNESGPNMYLSAGYFPTEEVDGSTRPYLARGDVADSSAYWNLSPWGDGTFYMWNMANMSDYRMMKKGSGMMAMSPNITAPQPGQRWQFEKIAEINDTQYSTVNLLQATSSTAISSSTSGLPSNETSRPDISSEIGSGKSHEMSSEVKIAIGVSTSGILLLSLIILGLFLIRKQSRGHKRGIRLREESHDSYFTSAQFSKFEMDHDSTVRHEMPARIMVEAPLNERPVELPGMDTRR